MSTTRALTAILAASALTAGVMLAGPATAGREAQEPKPSKQTKSEKLAAKAFGTWRMSVDPRPLQGPNGPIDPPAFPSLVALNQGGTMTDAVSSLAPLAAQGLQADDYTGGVGSWRIAGKKLKFTFERYFTKQGQYAGRQLVVGTGTAKGAGTTQVATVKFFDSSGSQVGPAIIVDVTGTRMNP